MEMVEIMGSSRIAAIGHDRDTLELEIEFVDGGTYVYGDVPRTVFDALKSAGSPGRYLDSYIKPRYQFYKKS
jgi:hypothetical protein